LNTKRAIDLVYVYINSKVIAASKKNNEKKWYHENVELEDSDYLVEEEENDFHDFDHDANDASNAMENDIHHLDDDLLESSNHNNEEFGAFEQNVFEFGSNEDNGRYNEDVVPIARFMDGNGLLNNKNILRGNDAHEEIAEMNGTTVDNDGDLE